MNISIVTPIYNDSYLAEDFIRNLEKVDWSEHQLYELIFIIDGSGKNDEKVLEELSKRFFYIKVIVLSRNFGQHIALSAGYNHAKGDFICMINVDQQDPVAEIPKLIKFIINENLDIVYGLRSYRKDRYFKVLSSRFFNFILNKLTGDSTPLNVATLRVMSRKFIDAYNLLNERSRYIPGLEFWIGFQRGYLPIEHSERRDGGSSYNFSKRLMMAIESIVSFSDLPLRWTALLGMTIAFVGFVYIILILIMKIYYVDFQPGYTSTIAAIIFIGGIQIFVIGMASVYIGRVLKEVQQRPLYIIRNKINFNDI